jgi:hypothetical protein
MNFTLNYYQARDIINQVLFKLDPMSTSCKENDLEDEYYEVATRIAYNWFSAYMTLSDSIKAEFDSNFWVDSLPKSQVNYLTDFIMFEMNKVPND